MRAFRWLLIASAGILLAGCAGYSLGPTNGETAGDKTIQISPFGNSTMEPHLGDALTDALRTQLQHDGTYRLATSEAGDIVVTGTVTGYDRREQDFSPADADVALDYRVGLTAQVTARERSTGKVVLDQPVSGYTLIRVGPDLTSVERQALPLLAEDLAKNITSLLVDGKW
jgi:hypothetical protein